MKILVSMRICENQSYHEVRDAVSHDWLTLFNKLEVLPILIPNNCTNIEQYFDITGIRGLLLTGGNNVADESSIFSLQRDKVEEELLKVAISKKIPIFGVCRGLQMINQYFGGKISKINPEIHVNRFHKIQFTESYLKFSTGDEMLVNSYHDFGIYHSDLSKELIPFAISEEGLVEGARHHSHNIIAIQWHPERLNAVASSLDSTLLAGWLGL